MPRYKALMAVVPTILVASAFLGAAGLFALLSNPQTVMRAALVAPETVVKPASARGLASYQQNFKPVADEFARPATAAGAIQPLGLTNSFSVGDRLTISRSEGRLRTLEVIEVRRLGALINKVADSDNDTDGNWAMIVSRDVEQPNGPLFRFLVQDGAGLPFAIKREDGRAL